MNTLQQSQQGEAQPQPIHIASREIVTKYQIDSCLSVIAMTGSMLGHYLRSDPESGNDKLTPSIPEARIALENTVISACARIDEIIKDPNRWGMEFQTEVEKGYRDAIKTQTEVWQQQKELVSKQQAAAEEVSSPHFVYRPKLLRMRDGSFCAFLGDLNYMDLGVVGVGLTAQDAIEAFDDSFRGVTNPKVLAWLAQRKVNLETGEPDKPFPVEQEQQTNEQTTLDEPGAGDIEETYRERDNRDSSGGTIGPERGLSDQRPPPFKHAEGGSFLNRLRNIFRRRDRDSG